MIRQAEPRDIEALLSMGRAFFAEAGHAKRDERCLFDDESFAFICGVLMDAGLLLVSVDDGSPIGMAALDVAPAYWNRNLLLGREAFWYISPSHRKGRDSRGLLAALEEIAKARGIVIFDVVAEETAERGPALARLYRAAGYQQSETTFRKRL